MSRVMNKNYIVILLVVLALSVFINAYAQTADKESQLTAEQVQEMIRQEKQLIREAAKQFLVDELPLLVARDANEADRALAQYGAMLKLLSDNDMLYLLGHFFTRVGEDEKAISNFDALLKTDLNVDARQMLNLVLYRKLISYFEKDDRQAAKDFLKAIILDNYNIEKYYSTYLYLWADMSADDGEYQSVLTVLENYNKNRDLILNNILPAKQIVIQKLDNLDFSQYYINPTQAGYDMLAVEIDKARTDLTGLYNQLISLKGVLFLDTIVNLHETELGLLDELKDSLVRYANTAYLASVELKPAESYVEAAKATSRQYELLIQLFDNWLQDKYNKFIFEQEASSGDSYVLDLELRRLFDLEQNIIAWGEIITEIDALLASGNYKEYEAQLLAERQSAAEKVADFEVRKQKHLSERKKATTEEQQLFSEILDEYYVMIEEKKDLDIDIAELEQFIRTEARTIVDEHLRDEIRPHIAQKLAEVRDSSSRDQQIVDNLREMISNIEFIKLQLAYRDTKAQDREYASLPEGEQKKAVQAQIQQRKLTMISQIQDFLSANPDFQAIEQPGDTYLVGPADLYYNLGELQFDAIRTDLQPALASYRKVIELDPEYPNKDAALYNIGFLSSELKRIEIANNYDAFLQSGNRAADRPANTMHKESDFYEALSSYQAIVSNFPNSQYYDESIYRLGLLNFVIGTDAQDSQRYYALAINYFDQLIDKPGSQFRYDAIYQRGWVRLNSSADDDLKLALADFLTILNAVESGNIKDPLLAEDYKDDAVNNIAYCLIALDGTDFRSRSKGVAELQRIFAGFQNAEVMKRVIDSATQKKFDLAASMQAIDFMQLKINIAPLSLENPVLLDSILTLYYADSYQLREGDNLDQIRLDIFKTMISDYSINSEWYSANKDKDITKQLGIVDKAYTQLGIRLHNNFMNQPTKENLLAYLDHTNEFDRFVQLHGSGYEAWRKESDRNVTVFYTYLADRFKDEQSYIEAIRQLHAFNDKYPEDDDFFNNEGLALNYAQTMYDMISPKFVDGTAPVGQDLPKTDDEAFSLFSAAALRFIDVSNQERYRSDANVLRANQINLGLADIQYNRGKYTDAAVLYTKALEYESRLDNRTKRDIYLKMADMAVKDRKYLDAESWFRKALPLALNDEDRLSITNDIRFQIQSNFESAAARGDFATEATERLRLASEFQATETNRVLGQKYAAQEAFVKAGQFQSAIDILLELAASEPDVAVVYSRYNDAWKIASAENMMNSPTLAANIEQEFIDKYPSSNQAFLLRINKLVEMEKNPAQIIAAADGYIQIHDEVKASKIDAGETQSSDLFEEAIRLYALAGNKTKEFELRNQFIATYPNHIRVVPNLELMAKEYFDRGDKDNFEMLAKEIFKRDKTKSSYYHSVASAKLKDIITEFDTAYRNKDYTAAFKARDSFRSSEAAYVKEGLTFDTADTYKFFADVQKEYDDIQKKLAFLKNYDTQLQNLERNEYLSKSPAAHISVNANTTWDKHLAGGSYKRLENFSKAVNTEVAKVTRVITQANDTGYDIDNSRRLRALNLITRYYDKAYDVVKTQIEQYFKISTEAAPYRKSYNAEQLKNVVDNVVSQFATSYLNASYSYHYDIYNRYHLAGYNDRFTEASVTKLQGWDLIPDFKLDEYPLNSTWQLAVVDGGSVPSISNVTTANNKALGSIEIPAEKNVIVKKQFSAKVIPDFALLHVSYPLDFEIKMNGQLLEASWIPVDTLETGKPSTTRYAYYLPGNTMSEGQNLVEIIYQNPTSVAQKLAMTYNVFTSRQRLKAAIPPQVVKIFSDQTWRVISKNPETGAETVSYASNAPDFGITWQNIQDLPSNSSRGIWVQEPDGPVASSIFEIDFTIDTEFIEGQIDFVAPETATIYLNGELLADNVMFDYDPDPLEVYPSQLALNKALITNGKNTVRFEIQNGSKFRGFLATITYSKAGKEEIR